MSSLPTALAETVTNAGRAHDAADLVLEDLAALLDVLRLDHPDPARRVLHRADRCAAAVGTLLAELKRFGRASRNAITLKASARVRRITESFLRDVWSCYVVTCDPDDPGDIDPFQLVPDWFGDADPGTFSRYADLLASVFVGEPPAAWTAAVAVQLANIARLFPAATLCTLARELRDERVAFGTVRVERAAVSAAAPQPETSGPAAGEGRRYPIDLWTDESGRHHVRVFARDGTELGEGVITSSGHAVLLALRNNFGGGVSLADLKRAAGNPTDAKNAAVRAVPALETVVAWASGRRGSAGRCALKWPAQIT